MSGGGPDEEVVEEGEGSPSSAFGRSVFGAAGEAVPHLNLTALMDILSNLLFFLLASFGASILMMINATVPVQASGRTDLAEGKKAVTLLVKLSRLDIECTATAADKTPEDLASLSKRIGPGAAGDEPAFDQFTAYLEAVKQQYPDSDTLILVPEKGVDYGLMIKLMDAAREKELYSGGQRKVMKLFPTVVVSAVVK